VSVHDIVAPIEDFLEEGDFKFFFSAVATLLLHVRHFITIQIIISILILLCFINL